jgi:hypothetical protein
MMDYIFLVPDRDLQTPFDEPRLRAAIRGVPNLTEWAEATGDDLVALECRLDDGAGYYPLDASPATGAR